MNALFTPKTYKYWSAATWILGLAGAILGALTLAGIASAPVGGVAAIVIPIIIKAIERELPNRRQSLVGAGNGPGDTGTGVSPESGAAPKPAALEQFNRFGVVHLVLPCLA